MRRLRGILFGKENPVVDTHLANSITKVQDAITKLGRLLLELATTYEAEVIVARREKRLLGEKRGAGP